MGLKVSVVIATYRRTDTLIRALNSLKVQSCKNFEIIVVDDNDEPKWNNDVNKIISDFIKDSKIQTKLIANHPNKGSAETRNVGIFASNGEYITFLDDDDEYLPAKLENQVNFMDFNQLDYSITDLDLYYENGKFSNRRDRKYIKQIDKNSLLKYHIMFHLTGTDTMMFRKDYLLKIGGFAPINVGDEFYLMQRAIEGAGKFGYLNSCDVKAYIHNETDGLSSGDKKIEGENRLFAYKKQFFNLFRLKEVRYIKMRHHAVLAYAYRRSGHMFKFISEAIKSILSAPFQCVKLLNKLQ